MSSQKSPPQSSRKPGFLYSMRFHIPLGIIIIMGVFLYIFGSVAIREQRERMMAQIDTYGRETVDFIAKISIVPLQKFSYYQLENYVKQIGQGELVVFCVIYDAKGNPLTNLPPSALREKSADIVVFTAPIIENDKTYGKVELGLNVAPVHARVDFTSYYIGIGFIIELCLIGLALSIFIHKKLVAPILHLSGRTEDISTGRFSISEKVSRADEIGDLERSVNEMSRKLRNSYLNLEQRVAERTKELFNAKNAAEKINKNLEIVTAEQQILLDNSPVGIVFFNTQLTIEKVNLEFCRITGYAPNELNGRTTRILYTTQEDYEAGRQLSLNQLEHANIEQATFELVRKDGTQITCSVRGRIAETTDNTKILIWSIEDITARLKMEEELHKIKKLESVGVLAGGIAHDFNNILVAIMGNISLCEQFVKNSKALELLDSAKIASIRARDLTEKLLTFAKGGEPVQTIEHLPDLIQESTAFILSGSNVTCEYTFDDDLWAVHMDKGQINQVIHNLVLNGSQSMADGGSISIRCHNRLIQASSESGLNSGPYVEIIVSDTGVGIAPEHIDKIFDPYFSTKEKDSNKGSGLGLAIVHSIIMKHNGTIEVQSTQQGGTTFKILLPASIEKIAILQEEVPTLRKGQGSILVMDDDKTIHEILKAIFAYLGYTIIHAYNGTEAIELYSNDFEQSREIVTVIMDLTIPGGMGGAQAAQKILRINPEAKLIVSSGYSDDPVIQNYEKAGFVNILSKPYQLTDVSNVLSEILANLR